MERRADIAWISRNRRFAAPVLGLYGAEDASITPDQIEAMKERLKAAGTGAGHGFFADYPQSYRADVAKDAWMAMQASGSKNTRCWTKLGLGSGTNATVRIGTLPFRFRLRLSVSFQNVRHAREMAAAGGAVKR